MPLVSLCNLGCSKNQIDGSLMLQRLCDNGYAVTDNFSQADIIMVNTCAFIEAARIEAIDKILEMAEYKKTGNCRTLVVCGCFSQRFREKAAREFPEVDLWTGVDDWPRLLESHLAVTSKPSFKRALADPRATQYLKISEGCSHRCAFCAIPLIRGKFRSRDDGGILEEARWLSDQGVKECILVSQDTSYYGRDRKTSLTRLLERVLKHTPIPWIRMMYLHPSLLDDDLLSLVAREGRICPYFDIPLQHAADPMLTAMNRRPLSKGIREVIERIRTRVPDAAIRTTFIVGFPGETEAHFQDLLGFVEEMKFDKVGVFPFSPEEGTPAFSMRPRPRNATVTRRCETLMSLQRDISERINRARVGRVVEVIVDGVSDAPGFGFEGRTRWDAPEVDGKTLVKKGPAAIGDIVPVLVQSSDDYDLFGELHR